MIVDVEHHIFPEEQTLKGHSGSGRVIERYRNPEGKVVRRVYEGAATAEGHLRFMDQSGIDIAVLVRNGELNVENSRKWNDLCAGIVRKYPTRFAGLATVPPLGGKPALDELERAVRSLGLKGVHIFPRSQGRYLDDEAYWPFYEKASDLNIPINVHVMMEPPGFDALHAAYPLYYVLAREFDICAATFRICLGGVLESFPDLIFIINHFGGGISSVLERMDAYVGNVFGGSEFYEGKPLITKPWREYFNKLYFNMAGREQGMDTVQCALTNIRPKKMMFGTDWPFNYDNAPEGVKGYISEIRNLDLPEDEIEGMLGGNAARLFRL